MDNITGLRASTTSEIKVISKEEFDLMWLKAFPAQRLSEICLPVLTVFKDGVYYVQEGHLEWKFGK